MGTDDDDDATNADVRTAGMFDDDGKAMDNDDDDEDDDDDSQTLEFLTPKLVGGRGWLNRLSRSSKRFCCCWNKRRI